MWVFQVHAFWASIMHMRNNHLYRRQAPRVAMLWTLALILFAAAEANAAGWKGLEPFVSKRADVEKVLGRPIQDRLAQDGALKFNMPDGTATVFFVTPKFVAAKNLSPELEGTVLQIVLSHTGSADTPATLLLVMNSAFKREARAGVDVYTNAKEGIVYTFVGNRLSTTRYTYSTEQVNQMKKRKP